VGVLIKQRAKKKWLTDERQLDDKRISHPAREFGHEPIVKGTFNPLTEAESEGATLMRLAGGLHAIGSFRTSTLNQRTVKVTLVSYDTPRYEWVIRERGKIVEKGVLA